MIYNSSGHPVIIKRIPIKVWALRNEIYCALKRRFDQTVDEAEVDYSDIQDFYQNKATGKKNTNKAEESDESADQETETEDLGQEETPPEAEDDDMAAMMSALQEGDDEAEEEEEGEDEADEEQSDQEEQDEQLEASTDDLDENDQDDALETAPEAETEEDSLEQDDSEQSDSEDQVDPEQAEKRVYERQEPDQHYQVEGFTFLADMNMDSIILFTRETFTFGQAIVIKFDIPDSFLVTAEVIRTYDYDAKSRIISDQKPGFRVQCRLIYSYPGERTHMRKFLRSIETDKPAKSKESAE